MSNPPPQEPPVRAQKLARWSLILGILTVLGFGPVTGLPAFFLGYWAEAAFRKCGVNSRGRKMATAGTLLGAVGSVVPLCVFVIWEKEGELEEMRVRQAKWTLQQFTLALNLDPEIRGKYVANLGDGEELTLGADNNRLFDVWRRARMADVEPDVEWEFVGAHRAHGSPPKNGFGPNGVVYDPWGHPYQVRINLRGEKGVTNPYKANAGPDPIPEIAIMWSLGPDGQLGHKGDGDAKADVVSWQ